MPQPEPEIRLPAEGPSASALRNVEEWEALVTSSVDRVTANAEKWRTGMAALVTVVTSLLFLKGVDLQKIPWPVNLWVIIPLASGAALMLAGLWHALEASAPGLKTQDYPSLVRDYGTVKIYTVAVAKSANNTLNTSKRMVLCALASFIVGIVAWWLIPPQTAALSKVSVTEGNGMVTCGALVESKNGTITLRPNGTDTTKVFALKDVNAVQVRENCASADA